MCRKAARRRAPIPTRSAPGPRPSRRGSARACSARRCCSRPPDYLACLVPTFHGGVLAGLGEPVSLNAPGMLDTAWPFPQPEASKLPVYDHWTFTPGEAGSFAALVERLQPFDASASAGRRLDASMPAGPDGPVFTDAVLGIERGDDAGTPRTARRRAGRAGESSGHAPRRRHAIGAAALRSLACAQRAGPAAADARLDAHPEFASVAARRRRTRARRWCVADVGRNDGGDLGTGRESNAPISCCASRRPRRPPPKPCSSAGSPGSGARARWPGPRRAAVAGADARPSAAVVLRPHRARRARTDVPAGAGDQRRVPQSGASERTANASAAPGSRRTARRADAAAAAGRRRRAPGLEHSHLHRRRC